MLTIICSHHIGSLIVIINVLKLCNKTVLIKTAATVASHHISIFPLLDGYHKLLTAEPLTLFEHPQSHSNYTKLSAKQLKIINIKHTHKTIPTLNSFHWQFNLLVGPNLFVFRQHTYISKEYK
jgi:hypothetical protein